MSEYTPTTDEVRECWAFRDPLATPDNHDAAEFDRWLRKVKAEVWDQCFDTYTASGTDPLNPYREKQ